MTTNQNVLPGNDPKAEDSPCLPAPGFELSHPSPATSVQGVAPYYSMLDTEQVVPIGSYASMSAAMDGDPHGNSVWTFSEEGLSSLIDSATNAMRGHSVRQTVMKILEVSTAHVSKTTRDWISSSSECLSAPESEDEDIADESVYFTCWMEYGWIFSVGNQSDKVVEKKAPELAKLFRHCIDNQIHFLRLDRDADLIPGHEVFSD